MYLNLFLFSLAVVSYLALGAALAFKYLRTRDRGFIWLGLAVVIWPIVTGQLDHILIRQMVRSPSLKIHTFFGEPLTNGGLLTSLYSIEGLIRTGLLLIAIVYLCKANSSAKQNATV